MSLKNWLTFTGSTSRHSIPELGEDGLVMYRPGTCDEKEACSGVHTRFELTYEKDGTVRKVPVLISCGEAHNELVELRFKTADQEREIRELRARNGQFEERLADKQRIQKNAIRIALQGGRVIAERLHVSPDVPIEAKPSPDGEGTMVDLPGVSLEFRVFDEILYVRLTASAEMAIYEIPDGEVSREIADAILGKLTRAGWDGETSLPRVIPLSGVVDGQQDA